MPWALEIDAQLINESLRNSIAINPDTLSELTRQQQVLLSPFRALTSWLGVQESSADIILEPLTYRTVLPTFSDVLSKYYSTVISNEVLRLYNLFIQITQAKTEDLDIIFQTSILLREVKKLLVQTVNEIERQDFELTDFHSTKLTSFVLEHLKLQLTALYFSVQAFHKEILPEIIEVEDFYLIELKQPVSKIPELSYVKPTGSGKDKKPAKKPKSLSFHFKGDDKELRRIISELCSNVTLLDAGVTSQNQLHDVLAASKVTQDLPQVKLGCETLEFAYIVEKLGSLFRNLTPTTIGDCGLFISKQGNPIVRQNLYSSKSEDFENKEIIDQIFAGTAPKD